MAENPIPTSKETEVEVPPTENKEQNGTGTVPEVETPIVEAPVEETPPASPVEVAPKDTTPPIDAPAKPEIDYKKKFGESTRNNQIVMSRFSELQKVLGDITRQEVPTEDEMRNLEPEWEYMSDREKRDATKLVVLERRQNHIFKTIGDITRDSENARKLDEFIENEPKLKGKEDDFIAFATKDSNQGASMETILKAFLYDVEEDVTPPVPTPEVPVETESAPTLERGNPSAGAPQEVGKKELDADDLKELRLKNPQEYMRKIQKGQI